MAFQLLINLAALLGTAQAFTAPCIYQQYKCGYNLANTTFGYNTTEFTTAVNKTLIIPPLSDVQLLSVLYRCEDVNGTLAGNSLCIAGCITMENGIEDDQCAM